MISCRQNGHSSIFQAHDMHNTWPQSNAVVINNSKQIGQTGIFGGASSWLYTIIVIFFQVGGRSRDQNQSVPTLVGVHQTCLKYQFVDILKLTPNRLKKLKRGIFGVFSGSKIY